MKVLESCEKVGTQSASNMKLLLPQKDDVPRDHEVLRCYSFMVRLMRSGKLVIRSLKDLQDEVLQQSISFLLASDNDGHRRMLLTLIREKQFRNLDNLAEIDT